MSYNAPTRPIPANSPLARSSLLASSRTTIRYSPKNFNTQNQHGDARDWCGYEARRSRYAIQWSHYEGALYDSINTWLDALKRDKSLYEFVRHIYSPANRLGEFWATHIYGGALDPEAGDGATKLSAIPILNATDQLRACIAKLWGDSNWQVHKETYGRFGAVMGDVGLTVVDDPQKGSVKLSVVDPRDIYDVREDKFGNCRGYVLKRQVPDPEWQEPQSQGLRPFVEYTEVCYRQGDMVVYETYRDNMPYDWANPEFNREADGVARTRWTEDYGFVPFIRVQHKDFGLGWGMSEFNPALLSKLYELDDQASKFGDYVRRAVDSPWLFSGIDARDVEEQEASRRTRTGDDRGDGRARVPAVYSLEPNARAQPLIAPLDLPAVMENIKSILRVIEQEHPELTADLALASGDASGRALRVAREKAEALVIQRRATYDDALRRLHQMAISIGAQKGYDGYGAFDAGSYARGDLAHQIGERAVFALNTWDKLEEELERAKVVELLVKAGVPLATAWKRAGYKDSEIRDMLAERDRDVEFQLKRIQVMQQQAATDGASYGIPQ